MAVPHHDNLEFVAGDDWDIGATLLRRDGTAYDLSQATVIWMLRGPDGDPVLTTDQYQVKVASPPSAGLLTIVIPASSTAPLRPGRYLDWLRATDNAGTDTFWTGIILVDPNPFGVSLASITPPTPEVDMSSVTALTSASFVVPAVGSSVAITVTMPWVDVGDTVSVFNNGVQFKGTVLGNTGSTLTVLNSNYAGTSTGSMDAGSPVSLCASPQLSSEFIYYCDDFDTASWNASGGGKWTFTGGVGWADQVGDHFGLAKLPAAAGAGLMTFGNGLTGVKFDALNKAVVRWVLSPDRATETGGNEWWCGFFNAFDNQQAGALFSNAEGFTGLPNANGVAGNVDATRGLIAGTYNTVSTNHYGYIQTNVMPVANQWLDLVIVWTPTANRFYAAVYGQPLQLVATITNNICNDKSIYPAVYNTSTTTSLLVDRCEFIYWPKSPNRFLGARLLGL